MMILFRFRLLICCVLGFFILNGCTKTAPIKAYPQITFSHLDPIILNIAAIEVVSSFNAPQKRPHVEHLFPVKIDDIVSEWANTRIDLRGSNDKLSIDIINASVIEKPILVNQGLVDLVKIESESLYQATIEIQFKIQTNIALTIKNIKIKIERDIKEFSTLSDRQDLWYEMASEFAQLLNKAAEDMLLHDPDFAPYRFAL
ncbi:MAG: hypothetical protein AAF403_03815 [Pseudomonadota bacterium]